jgi:hypothetical protein
VVVNLMLRGGPDFRHIIVPPFAGESSGPGFLYWSNRWRSHGLGQDPEDWQRRYASDFVPVQIGGRTLGIWKDAGWLRAQIAAGKAALCHNVVGATSRGHSHAELVWESGARATTPNDFTRDGWGGRLAQDLGGRVVSMTSPVRLFCNGRHASDPHLHDNAHVITASDTRNIALHRPDVLATEPASRGAAAVLSRW